MFSSSIAIYSLLINFFIKALQNVKLKYYFLIFIFWLVDSNSCFSIKFIAFFGYSICSLLLVVLSSMVLFDIFSKSHWQRELLSTWSIRFVNSLLPDTISTLIGRCEFKPTNASIKYLKNSICKYESKIMTDGILLTWQKHFGFLTLRESVGEYLPPRYFSHFWYGKNHEIQKWLPWA